MKTIFSLGFVFNHDKTQVLMIRKLRPDWQNGKLNGVGGHFESEKDNDVLSCMKREFHEEVEYPYEPKWTYFATLNSDKFNMTCYASIGDLGKMKSKTDEKIEIIDTISIHPLRGDMVENVSWLVGMAIDTLDDGRPSAAFVSYP